MDFLLGVLTAVLLIAYGFYLGRKTVAISGGEVDVVYDPGKIPLAEQDPYRTAMTGEQDVIEDVR